ncbi:MAG: hypothetical protein AAF705_20245 [Bacteroidota bacterium]
MKINWIKIGLIIAGLLFVTFLLGYALCFIQRLFGFKSENESCFGRKKDADIDVPDAELDYSQDTSAGTGKVIGDRVDVAPDIADLLKRFNDLTKTWKALYQAPLKRCQVMKEVRDLEDNEFIAFTNAFRNTYGESLASRVSSLYTDDCFAFKMNGTGEEILERLKELRIG